MHKWPAAAAVLGAAVILSASGCGPDAAGPVLMGEVSPVQLRERAWECLTLGVRYPDLATVRVQSIEALQEVGGPDALPWIRQALHDEVPAVRFAAAMALGTARDKVAEPAIRKLAASGTPTDRVGAAFALHRLGYRQYSAELAHFLSSGKDWEVRRNAALALGRLEDPGAMKLLYRAMRERDLGLRLNTLEALALLGSDEARTTLYAQAYAGLGAEETFAVQALAQTRDPKYKDLFAERMKTSAHQETRLAAARGLGLLGDASGFDLAMRATRFTATKGEKHDPAPNKTLRVRQLAVHALGAIRDKRALPRLQELLNTEGEPRLQVAAAKAILEIVAASPLAGKPLPAPPPADGP
jgi:HEAT repeat protein